MDPISVQHAVDIIPILDISVLTSAALSYNAEDINTDLLIQNFARDARASGAEIRTKSPVTAIEKTANGWTITTGNTQIQTKILINAAGAWADEIAKHAGSPPIGLTPYRRSMARIRQKQDCTVVKGGMSRGASTPDTPSKRYAELRSRPASFQFAGGDRCWQVSA